MIGCRSRWLALLGALSILAGCAPNYLPCPSTQILREAASVTKFASNQPSGPTAVAYVGSIADAKLSCSYDVNTQSRLTVVLGVQVAAERNPNLRVDAADLKYFVAIVNLRGEVQAKKEFPLTLPFPPGSTVASKVERIDQTIPLKYPQNGGSLQVWVGFQLSDAELQYNRSHGGT
jgi:hypothetical protein